MLLTISTTHTPATDLGYLLHKNPAHLQSFNLAFGQAHVFYPIATTERCSASLLLDVDPVGLVRGRPGSSGAGSRLGQYVNDRPYVASSFLSVAIAQVFGSALAGRSKDRPELAATPLPLTATIAALPCHGGADLLRRLFEPLGYSLTVQSHALDAKFPEWGESAYYSLEMQGLVRLCDLLAHLYVLIPVLDDDKHYWVGEDEADKLLRHGAGWLAAHPERETIARRYLKHRQSLARETLARLAETTPDPDATAAAHAAEEAAVEKPLGLHEQRLNAVMDALKNSGAKRILDLGCGEGRLLQLLLKDKTFEEMLGLDVSYRALEIAGERLRLEQMSPRQRERIQLLHGALTYRDQRLAGYDAAAVVEVIEHLDPPRLAAFERVLFGFARPGTVVLTTPNQEYNVKWETLPAGKMRHKDHRFEWTRAEFESWATIVGERYGYMPHFSPIGPADPELGAPTQMGVFTRD